MKYKYFPSHAFPTRIKPVHTRSYVPIRCYNAFSKSFYVILPQIEWWLSPELDTTARWLKTLRNSFWWSELQRAFFSLNIPLVFMRHGSFLRLDFGEGALYPQVPVKGRSWSVCFSSWCLSCILWPSFMREWQLV